MTTPLAEVRKAIESSGNSWLFDYWGKDQDQMIQRVAGDLDAFVAEYQARFGEKPDPFTLAATDPYKGKAFFQVDTLLVSTEMKVMVWRILLGCEIAAIRFHYHLAGQTVLVVTLKTPYGEEEHYHAKQPRDFRVLRHLGAVESNGDLILQGYYALR